jgi:uridylate kinase
MQEFSPERVHRVVFQDFGEFLAGAAGHGFDHVTIEQIVNDIIEVKRLGVSIGIVLGRRQHLPRRIARQRDHQPHSGGQCGHAGHGADSIILAEYLRSRNYQTEIFAAIQADRVTKFYARSGRRHR